MSRRNRAELSSNLGNPAQKDRLRVVLSSTARTRMGADSKAMNADQTAINNYSAVLSAFIAVQICVHRR